MGFEANRMGDVALIGEPLVLFTAGASGQLENAEMFYKSLAGAELNVAIGLTRLNHKVQYISKVGRDSFGNYVVNELKNKKISTEYISRSHSYQTGVMFKNKVEFGDPSIQYYRENSAFTQLTADDININFENLKILHITGIPPAISNQITNLIIEIIMKAKEHNVLITFDPNIREMLWKSRKLMISTLNQIASLSDIILPGLSEAKILTGSDKENEIAQFYFDKGVETVIIKNGPEGATLIEKNKSSQFIKGFKVDEVIDTVGAGDGFATGVLHGILNDTSLNEAVMFGNAIGSLQVQHTGDNEGLPTIKRLLKYLENS